MKPWIQTFSRVAPTYPLDLRPAMVCIEDIAHALSLKCRWNGHTRTFYSVAEHSVRVALLLRDSGCDPRMQLAGLLHDAAEAYLPDIAGPIKEQFAVLRPRDVVFMFTYVEYATMKSILRGLALDAALPWECPEVHHADLVLLSTEARDLMHGTDRWEWQPPAPLPDAIEPWPWERAKAEFMAQWDTLRSAGAA